MPIRAKSRTGEATTTRSRGTDAIALLKQDHKEVKALFEQACALGTRATEQRRKLYGQIAAQLRIHSQVEEEIFYPAFRERTRNASDERQEVLEAYEEHGIVKHLLGELDATDPKDESFLAKFQVLKENVEHHVREEEGEMFKMARAALDKEELIELGSRIEAAKEEARA
ncbi:MAG: hemerythrin domain-containing protein [Candidatus Eremiobacteraeota bacterium]|nr:hemerythrin domain-containing protein [Candidatus Eremiobacteraeota bacterium]